MNRKISFNWVDIMVLILIVAALVAVLQRDKIFGDKGVLDVIQGKRQLIVTAKSPSVPQSVVDAFKVGDAPMAGGTLLDGEVIDVKSKPSVLFELKDGQIIKTTRPDYYDVYVTFKLTANSYASYMEQGGQELKVGVNYYIKTENAVSYGYIVGIKDVEGDIQ